MRVRRVSSTVEYTGGKKRLVFVCLVCMLNKQATFITIFIGEMGQMTYITVRVFVSFSQ